MKGDFSRASHQPHRHYDGVLMQQGRVTLDADWNEQYEIRDHRWRVQTIDTIGRACAPIGEPGFGLSLTADGTDLIISPGRIYIDGLLVELLPGTPAGLEPLDASRATVRDLAPDGRDLEVGQWVEVSSEATDDGSRQPTLTRIVSVDPEASVIEVDADLAVFEGERVVARRITTYLTQPYFPADEAPPFGEPFHPEDWAGATHVAYLDVWRRHVTAIEDPHIREVALGGPDTATRLQTVWALRILRDPERQGEPADANGIGCADPLPAWDELVAPPAGRLAARAEAAAVEDDPCAIQPEAGYRGLENRLYRVEIHDPGERGTATFKWSRDNGSILSSIVGFPDVDEIDVHSLGKDEVLRFHADDRVEVLSDESELSGQTGTMASIVGAPDEAERRIQLDVDVSLYETHTRPRVRRWDHGADEIETTSGWIELEHGVQIEFGDGPFRRGDYWLIPARVETGDVEGFVDAPPRGVDHHVARLALVTWPDDDTGTILDCRHTFPRLCELEAAGAGCCTVSVGDEGDVTTLQEALDAVADIDGPVRICVLAGEHRLPQTTVIRRSDLTISGCGHGSRIVALQGGALRFEGGSSLRVEDLSVFSASTEPTIAAAAVRGLEVNDCRVVNGGRTRVDDADDLTAVVAPGAVGRVDGLADASHEDFAREGDVIGELGRDAMLAPSYTIARSRGPAVGTTDSSQVVVRDCWLRGTPAVNVQGDHVGVERNLVVGGGVWLREGTEDAVISGNTITFGHGAGVQLGGLADGEDPREGRSGLRAIAIRANRIEAMTREGISSMLLGGDLVGDLDDLTIESNEIVRCGLAPVADGVGIGGGILLRDCSRVRILHNRIENNGAAGASDLPFALGFGVAVMTCFGLEVHGNTIADNGRSSGLGREGFTLNVGVAALGAYGALGVGDELMLLDAPAASIRDNVIVTPEGPSVLAIGLGPIAVDDNSLVSRYLGRSLLDVGRAVLLVNLGAAPDLGLDVERRVFWPLFHGRTQVHDNQVTVQAAASGLPSPDPDLDPSKVPIPQLTTGSAVAVLSFDAVSVTANQVLNEVRPEIDARRTIRSSVWVTGATVQTFSNRITELRNTALWSYAGRAFTHNASDNTTTHCMRVDGDRVIERDNQELFCLREVGRLVDFVHLVYGGAS